LGKIQILQRLRTEDKVLEFLARYRYKITLARSPPFYKIDCPSIMQIHKATKIERKSLTRTLERMVSDGRILEVKSRRKRQFYCKDARDSIVLV
jgi:hypothetical protein